MRSSFKQLLGLCSFLLLVSCGGGSGGNAVTPTPDTTAPIITLTGSSTLNHSLGDNYSELGASALDDVDGNITVIITGSVDESTLGSYSLTYTATDTAGNTSSLTRIVNVVDTTAPIITLNGDQALNLPQGEVFTDLGATATDNADATVTVEVTGNVDNTILGSYVITYAATDASGNSSSVTRTINVVDITAPVITLLGDNPLNVTEGRDFIDPGATALDDNGAVTVTVEGVVDNLTIGGYTLTYTATDASGNTSTETRTVNVNEIEFTDVEVLRCIQDNLLLSEDEIPTRLQLETITDLSCNEFSSIHFSSEESIDLSILSSLINLEALSLQSGGLVLLGIIPPRLHDLAAIFNLKKIESLDIALRSLNNDISGILALENLKVLRIIDNSLDGTIDFSRLTALTSLDMSLNNIESITAEKLPSNLESLGLAGNRIEDISFLGNLTNLRSLLLGNNCISDFTVITSLPLLENFDPQVSTRNGAKCQ